MEYVYKTLENEISHLVEEITQCSDVEKKAELIGNKILLEHSINLLKKCDEYGVCAGSLFTKLPPAKVSTPSSDYRVVEDYESDDSKYWKEVTIESRPFKCVRLSEGDVVIEI